MKRSLIAWDENELPRSTFDRRLANARAAASSLLGEVEALVVYTDVFRSNAARRLVNFMPYWGASLLVVPIDGEPVLLCGNSPRAYPWLRTVTYVADLRPSKDLGAAMASLASERGWTRVGVSDLPKLPYGIHRALRSAGPGLELLDLPSRKWLDAPDEVELAMRRHAAVMTRKHLEKATAEARGSSEHALVAHIEALLRGGGMTDTFIRLSDGTVPPRPASDRLASDATSVVVASDYRGHWVSLSRPVGPIDGEARAGFLAALRRESAARQYRFDLTEDGPFGSLASDAPLEPGRLLAVHVELSRGRLYGDTCVIVAGGSLELL